VDLCVPSFLSPLLQQLAWTSVPGGTPTTNDDSTGEMAPEQRKWYSDAARTITRSIAKRCGGWEVLSPAVAMSAYNTEDLHQNVVFFSNRTDRS
jgi:hypothetical protein